MLLVVEKDPRFTAKFKKHLKVAGLRNFFVETCSDALYLLKSMRAKFILINLNGADSWESLERLHGYGQINDVPLLFMEGFRNTRELAAKLRGLGEKSIVQLPLTVSELTTLIERQRVDRDSLLHSVLGASGHEMRILRKIGSGAMGTVYEAYQENLARRVAIKFLNLELRGSDREAETRFTNEARAMANMRSPHVVHVYSVGAHEGRPYMVMEYIDGPNLEKHMMAKKQLKIPESLLICKQVLLGLGEAHRSGRVHRDMKPANVMLNPTGEAVILDFGLVVGPDDEKITKAGTVLGTPRDISPEQVHGRQVDPRSDIYSLGIILFEMLVGEPPFKAADFVGVLLKHAKEPLPRPEAFGASLPPRLFDIIRKMTEKNPDERYQTVDENIRDINLFLENMSGETALDASGNSLSSLINPLGGLAVDASGNLLQRFGEVSQGRGQALFVLKNAIQQLREVEDLGDFQRGILNLDDSKLLIYNSHDGLAGIESRRPDAALKFNQISVEDASRLFNGERP